ncbi:DUF6037 family protein [Paenibacillus amylolyticus]|uniref:DUF6037 family protein n=1 Tax=Paenibacillus amylolyticus TaxID=1451 RepID=UPI003D967A75
MTINITAEIKNLIAICEEKSTDSILFNFEHNGIKGSVVFFLNSITFMIGIKDYNVGWLASVTNNYLSESLPLDVFREIKNMLDVVEYVKTDKGGYHRHSTSGLFQTISARMRSVQLDEVIIPAEQELIESIRRTRTKDRNYDMDGERPFFKTWSRNTYRGRVEAHNLEKTKRVFGRDIENHCRKNNISSVWSSTPTNKSLLFRTRTEEIIREI